MRALVAVRVGTWALLACGLAAAHADEHYTIDPLHSIPEFEFKHLGLTTQTGRFDRVRGSISLDRRAHHGSVDYEVEAGSLNMGFGTETPNSPGYILMQVADFPVLHFHSERLYFDDQDRVIAASGELTLLGVHKPLTVWVRGFVCAPNPLLKHAMCAGNITATVYRSEFGMLGFIPAISDQVKLSIPVEAYQD